MKIRKSNLEDIKNIMDVFSIARNYMVSHGNPTQWEEGYPNEDILRSDILNNNNCVILDDDTIVGTFSFIIGDEPTYQVIKNGNWHYDLPYGTIHRLASNGTSRGIANACFSYCLEQIDYIRVDTHNDNILMQTLFEKFGFQKCGNIYVRNGSERIAYDLIKSLNI